MKEKADLNLLNIKDILKVYGSWKFHCLKGTVTCYSSSFFKVLSVQCQELVCKLNASFFTLG